MIVIVARSVSEMPGVLKRLIFTGGYPPPSFTILWIILPKHTQSFEEYAVLRLYGCSKILKMLSHPSELTPGRQNYQNYTRQKNQETTYPTRNPDTQIIIVLFFFSNSITLKWRNSDDVKVALTKVTIDERICNDDDSTFHETHLYTNL